MRKIISRLSFAQVKAARSSSPRRLTQPDDAPPINPPTKVSMVPFAVSIRNAIACRLWAGAVGVAIGLSSGSLRTVADSPGSPPR
ncbi:MAG TPA: hypothetical protein VIO33_23630 [Burkholderiaceae bacterium]